MMKRLVSDESLHEGPDICLADLLRAARPLPIDPFRKRRILVRLERALAPMRPRFWVRPAVVAALLVSGSAAAALGHSYGGSGLDVVGLGGAEEPTRSSVVAIARSVAPPQLATPAESADEPALPAADPPAKAARGKTAARARSDSGEDATRVLEAIEALRAERDPGRAQALLDDYLKTHARGVLSEDALALSIEAASARHDARAADYARRYLAAYPSGKYRAFAMRALEMRY